MKTQIDAKAAIRMILRLLSAATAVCLLSAPAFAQNSGGNPLQPPPPFQVNDFQADPAGTAGIAPPLQNAPDRNPDGNGPGLPDQSGDNPLQPPPPHKVNGFQADPAGTAGIAPPLQNAPDRNPDGNGPGLWIPGGRTGFGFGDPGIWGDPTGGWSDDGIVLPRGLRIEDTASAGRAGRIGGFAPAPAGGGYGGIPEPATLLLLGIGATLALRRRH